MKAIFLSLLCILTFGSCSTKNDTMNQLVIFTLKPAMADAFKKEAIKSLHASLKEEGNLDMKLYVDDNDTNTLYVYSRWKNEEAYKIHKAQDYTTSLSNYAKTSLASAPRIIVLGETQPIPLYDTQHKNSDSPKETLFFIFKFKEEYRESFLHQFKDHIEHTRKEKGNLLFDLYTINSVNNEFVVYEQWRNKSDIFDIHFKQPYAVKTGKLINEGIVGDLEQYMHFVSEIK